MSRTTPVLFGAAAVVLAIGEACDLQSVGTTDAAQLRSVLAAPPALLQVPIAAFVVGAFLLILAIASAWGDAVGRGGRWMRTGLVFVAAGAVWYAWSRAAGDSVATVLAHLPRASALTVLDGSNGPVGFLDPVSLVLWLVGPIVYFVGARRGRRAPWALLVVYVVAAVVEAAFAFVSLPVEGATSFVAIGALAAMTAPGRRSVPTEPLRATVAA